MLHCDVYSLINTFGYAFVDNLINCLLRLLIFSILSEVTLTLIIFWLISLANSGLYLVNSLNTILSCLLYSINSFEITSLNWLIILLDVPLVILTNTQFLSTLVVILVIILLLLTTSYVVPAFITSLDKIAERGVVIILDFSLVNSVSIIIPL